MDIKEHLYGESGDPLKEVERTTDGRFRSGRNGVEKVLVTGDGKVEFVVQEEQIQACVLSSLGYPAYYPVHEPKLEFPTKGVLMDLDGTSVRSEEFWIWIIEQTTATLLKNPNFGLEEGDIPHVSGHSVSEHLKYCIEKYAPESSLEAARQAYFSHTHEQMAAILAGKGRTDAFTPTEGLKEFLLELKGNKIKIGLVTSGLWEKAWPEIVAAFRTMKMGDPKEFYDAIITAGYPMRGGEPGTMGELCPKPHPWLYAETGVLGLGIPFKERHHVVGIEDSGAGVCSIRLAGYSTIGLSGGNIVESGTQCLCQKYTDSFSEILTYLNLR